MKRHVFWIWLALLLGTCSGMWWLVFRWGVENHQLVIGCLAALGLLAVHAWACHVFLDMGTLDRPGVRKPEVPPYQCNGKHSSEPGLNGTGQHREE